MSSVNHIQRDKQQFFPTSFKFLQNKKNTHTQR